MDSRTHMYKDQIKITNKYCERLINSVENPKADTVLRCLACVISSRMRMFVRELTQMSIYNMLGEIPALKRYRATERKQIAAAIKMFTEY